jgi:hypothetical protein
VANRRKRGTNRSRLEPKARREAAAVRRPSKEEQQSTMKDERLVSVRKNGP